VRILVVDDQKSKYKQLRPIVKSIFPKCRIKHSITFLRAIANLENELWDLVFLDMSFDVNDQPSEDVGFEGLAGLQVLQHLYRIDSSTKVIIFTAHNGFEDPFHDKIEGLDELRKHVKLYFDGLCLGCIYSKDNDLSIEQQIRTLWYEGQE